MPLRVQKSGDKFKVVDDKGRVSGTHETRGEAVKQIQAINISKAKRK